MREFDYSHDPNLGAGAEQGVHLPPPEEGVRDMGNTEEIRRSGFEITPRPNGNRSPEVEEYHQVIQKGRALREAALQVMREQSRQPERRRG